MGTHSTVSGDSCILRQTETFGSLQGRDPSMGELGGELWGPVGLVVDVIRWSVELDPRDSSDGFNLKERSAWFGGS